MLDVLFTLLVYPLFASSTLTISGIWTADNSGEIFINNVSLGRQPNWDKWSLIKQIPPVTLNESTAVLQITVRNILYQTNTSPAALFAHVFVNNRSYSLTGDGNWLSSEPYSATTPPFELSTNATVYPHKPAACVISGTSHWDKHSANFSTNLMMDGVKPDPIWRSDGICSAVRQTRTFALAISSEDSASEAKRLWMEGRLFGRKETSTISSETISTATATTTQSPTKPTSLEQKDQSEEMATTTSDTVTTAVSIVVGSFTGMVGCGVAAFLYIQRRGRNSRAIKSFESYYTMTIDTTNLRPATMLQVPSTTLVNTEWVW